MAIQFQGQLKCIPLCHNPHFNNLNMFTKPHMNANLHDEL